MDSDVILIYKMKQGDDAAWESFVRKYYGDILKYCFFHCCDRHQAEDLAQEVFLRFCGALNRYEHRGKAKHYLYTIAANLCKSFRANPQEVPLEEAMTAAAEQTEPMEERLWLEAGIRSLPEEFRDVIQLHYIQGLKLNEVARVLDIGLPLTKYRLKRGREMLRKLLEGS